MVARGLLMGFAWRFPGLPFYPPAFFLFLAHENMPRCWLAVDSLSARCRPYCGLIAAYNFYLYFCKKNVFLRIKTFAENRSRKNEPAATTMSSRHVMPDVFPDIHSMPCPRGGRRQRASSSFYPHSFISVLYRFLAASCNIMPRAFFGSARPPVFSAFPPRYRSCPSWQEKSRKALPN